MSDYAYRVPENMGIDDPGVLDAANLVMANDLTDDDRDYIYRCPGDLKNGIVCYARMTICISFTAHRNNHFGIHRNSKHNHTPTCPHDKKRKLKTMNHVNMTGEGIDDDKLLDSLGKSDRKNKAPKIIDPPDHTETTPPSQEDKEEKPDNRQIKHEARKPKNIGELLDVLTKQPGNNLYSGIPITQRLINRRSINTFREKGADSNFWMIIIGKKTANSASIRNNNSELVIEDAYYYGTGNPPIYFILTVNDYQTKSELLSAIAKSKSTDRIAVVAKWERVVKEDYTIYRSTTNICAGHFCILSKEEYPY